MAFKTCRNCKHFELNDEAFPCRGCDGDILWEPKIRVSNKTCANCKYLDLGEFEGPCKPCDVHYSGWMPITHTKIVSPNCYTCRNRHLKCDSCVHYLSDHYIPKH